MCYHLQTFLSASQDVSFSEANLEVFGTTHRRTLIFDKGQLVSPLESQPTNQSCSLLHNLLTVSQTTNETPSPLHILTSAYFAAGNYEANGTTRRPTPSLPAGCL